jgi:hypothetical protein
MKVLDRAVAFLAGRGRERVAGPKIALVDGGFRYEGEGDAPLSIKWSEIRTIRAWKADEITSDLIWWSISIEQDGIRSELKIHEDVQGFANLEHDISRHNGFDSHWREKVLPNAFEKNIVEIFSTQST